MADDNEPSSDPVDMASLVDEIIEGAGDEPPPDTVVFGDALRRSADLWLAEFVFDEPQREAEPARLYIDGVGLVAYIQQPNRLNYVSVHEPAYLRTVSCNPYPEISKALTQWHANDDMGDPVGVFPSWRNFGGGDGRVGWEVVITATDDDLWTWDAWTAAVVVLAGEHMRDQGVAEVVVGSRRCPECRARGLVFRWFASIADGLDAHPMHDHDREWSPDGGLGGVLYVSSESGRACIGLTCGECRGAKSVDVRLLDLVFSAAQGWPWALEHGAGFADRLQAAGDPWGLWLAALLEPRAWGGWVSHPTRRAVARDVQERLDAVVERRQASAASRMLDKHGELVGITRAHAETDGAFRGRILAQLRGDGPMAHLAGPGTTVTVRVEGPVFAGQSVYFHPSNPGVFSALSPAEREGWIRAGTVVSVEGNGLAAITPSRDTAVNSAGEAMLVEPRAELSAGYTALQPVSLRAAITRAGVMAYPVDTRVRPRSTDLGEVQRGGQGVRRTTRWGVDHPDLPRRPSPRGHDRDGPSELGANRCRAARGPRSGRASARPSDRARSQPAARAWATSPLTRRSRSLRCSECRSSPRRQRGNRWRVVTMR